MCIIISKPCRNDQKKQPWLFDSEFKSILNPKHQIKLLADVMDWSYFENAFEPLYAKTGHPAHPIWVIVGCLMLKRLCNLGDEILMERWIENP
ncbi:MAG: hypothetical protein OXC61_10820 [Flavobacteriaceae bacterium]|nr:hypothetical protein [Flavobacteriaceae bacterium]